LIVRVSPAQAGAAAMMSAQDTNASSALAAVGQEHAAFAKATAPEAAALRT